MNRNSLIILAGSASVVSVILLSLVFKQWKVSEVQICKFHQEQLQQAKEAWSIAHHTNALPSMDDLWPYLNNKAMFECPAGGHLSFDGTHALAKCNIHGCLIQVWGTSDSPVLEPMYANDNPAQWTGLKRIMAEWLDPCTKASR